MTALRDQLLQVEEAGCEEYTSEFNAEDLFVASQIREALRKKWPTGLLEKKLRDKARAVGRAKAAKTPEERKFQLIKMIELPSENRTLYSVDMRKAAAVNGAATWVTEILGTGFTISVEYNIREYEFTLSW